MIDRPPFAVTFFDHLPQAIVRSLRDASNYHKKSPPHCNSHRAIFLHPSYRQQIQLFRLGSRW